MNIKNLEKEIKNFSIVNIFICLITLGLSISFSIYIAYDGINYINIPKTIDSTSIFSESTSVIPYQILVSFSLNTAVGFLLFILFITNCVSGSTNIKSTSFFIFNLILSSLILISLAVITYFLYGNNLKVNAEAEKLDLLIENLASKTFIKKTENYKSFKFYAILSSMFVLSFLLILFTFISLEFHYKIKKPITEEKINNLQYKY